MRARLEPDSDIISGAFRNGNSGLDSGLKQGHRCVSEHPTKKLLEQKNQQGE